MACSHLTLCYVMLCYESQRCFERITSLSSNTYQ
uniref:Uncharacterized protein n=1 Tax=Anguilla anguilla TaxID=7936 RepID=A0A0E9UQ83_ANGAN